MSFRYKFEAIRMSASRRREVPPQGAPARSSWLGLVLLSATGVLLGWLAFQASAAIRAWREHDVDAGHGAAAAGANESASPESCCNDAAGADEKQQPSMAFPENAAALVRINDASPPSAAPDGMAWIPGGVFWRGNNTLGHRDARPWHRVALDGFWMDVAPVTNEQFAKFVKATGYVTVAERTPRAEDYPGAPPENLVAGSVIFSPPSEAVPLNDHLQWWKYVHGANWRHPDGPDSNLQGREQYPVVHVAYDDAQAYCKWASKRLPTEAEFEFAARGGLDRQLYAWGDELHPGGRWMANIWQGRFPIQNTADDGYRGISPVKSFPANRFGLHDVAGNVWEWCSDWYRHDYYRTLAAQPQPIRNPQGPADSDDPAEPGVAKRVMRGGSYLCTDQYCTAYEAGARGKGAPDTGTNHVGFRCAK